MITHEDNLHNCQLCEYEYLGRCFGLRYGTDVSVENTPCSGYVFAGAVERLKEIEQHQEETAKAQCIGEIPADVIAACNETARVPVLYAHHAKPTDDLVNHFIETLSTLKEEKETL